MFPAPDIDSAPASRRVSPPATEPPTRPTRPTRPTEGRTTAAAIDNLAEAIRELTAAITGTAATPDPGTTKAPGPGSALHTAIRTTPNHRDHKNRSVGFGPVDA